MTCGFTERAAVRKDGETVRHLERRQLRRAERSREVRRDVLLRQAEAGDVVARVADADLAHDADRHEVARARERVAQPCRAVEALRVVAGPPVLLLGLLALDRGLRVLADADLRVRRFVDDGRVGHDRGRREAVIETGGVHERLERGAGLAARLRRAIEVVQEEIEATVQRHDRAVERVDRDERALNLGDLRRRASPLADGRT